MRTNTHGECQRTDNRRKNRQRISVMLAATIIGSSVLPTGCSRRQANDTAGPVAETDGGLSDLNASYMEPARGKNAATFYLQECDAMRVNDGTMAGVPLLGKAELPKLGAPMTPGMKGSLASFIESNREGLSLLAQGAKCEQSRYPVDVRQGIDALFPHLPKLKTAAMVTELAAILHAEQQDGEQAAEDVRISLGLAGSLAAEPSLLSQLLRAGNVSIAVAALERIMNRTAVPEASLIALEQSLAKLERYDARGEGFDLAMKAERATSIGLLGSADKLERAMTAPGVNMPAEARAELLERMKKAHGLSEERDYIETTFSELAAVRKGTLPYRLRADAMVSERVSEAAGRKMTVVCALLAGLAGRTAREAECVAHLRLALMALALEQYRAAHQQYPGSLSELATAHPDPFDGRPMRYRKNGFGYLIYSVGPDLCDNSGARRNGKTGDLVFAVISGPKAAK